MEKFTSGDFEAEVYTRDTGVKDIVEDKVVNNSDREVRWDW